jgi:hypothetical protein
VLLVHAIHYLFFISRFVQGLQVISRSFVGINSSKNLLSPLNKNFISFSIFVSITILFRFWLLTLLDRSFKYIIFLVFICRNFFVAKQKFS